MNLKKILTGVVVGAMAVSAMAVGAFAEKTSLFSGEENLGTDWGKNVTIQKVDVKEGDTISIGFTTNSDDAYAQLKIMDSDWTPLTGPETNAWDCVELTMGDTQYDLKLNAADAEAISSKGLIVSGYNVTIKSIDLETAEVEPAPAEGLETVLVVQDNKTWATVKSEKVNVAIGNEYTYSLTGLDIEPGTLTVMYIKDVAAMDLPEGTDPEASKIDPVKVTFTSVKINGKEIAVKEGMPTALDKNGIFDFALYNTWGSSYIDLPEENINTVEIAIKVEAAEEPAESSSSSEEPAESSSSSEEPAETTPESSASEASATEAVTEATTGAGFTAPADDKNQPTGIALAVVPAVLAAAGVIVAKKRK